MSLLPPRQRVARSLAAGAVVLTTALATTTTLASASTADRQSGKPTGPERSTQAAEARGHYDARYGQSGAARAATYRAASKASRSSETRALQASIPGQAIFDIDGTTGTVRILERLDGYLTGKSNLKPTRVVTKYLDANHDALGLTKSDLKTFKLKRDYKDIEGVHHLFWIQRIGGKTVFGNGLTAAVTKDGRLLTLGGSPVSKAHLPAPANTKIESGSQAIADARASLGATDAVAGPSDSAEQVLFVTPRGSYVGWLTTIMSVRHPATQVVDSVSGRLLYRNPLTNDEAGEATGTAFPNYPGAARGGKQITVNYTRNGWLPRGATKLKGNNSHTYSDVNDDNKANPSEEVHPNAGSPVERRPQAVHGQGHVLLQAVPLLVGPQRPVLVEGQPRPERRAGLLLRQPFPRPPPRRRRSASSRPPATSRTPTRPSRARATTRSTRRPWTAPTPPTACRTPTTSTTPT